jgi:ribosome production factor 2
LSLPWSRHPRSQVLLKKPDAKLLTRKNDILPFEDATSLEFLCDKNECSSFIYTSHNKKRPNNLVLGRMFDGHVLDMIELGLAGDSLAMADIEGPKKLLAAKPLFTFQGDEWERHPTLGRLKSMLLDCFGAKDPGKMSLPAIDHVISVTAVPGAGAAAGATGGPWAGIICWRVFTVLLKSSGTLVPRVELLPHGPSMDWTIRRTHFPASDLDKEANRIPAQLRPKKVKNVSHDDFGETLGRLHMVRQDFTSLHLRKTRAVKSEVRESKKVKKAGEGRDVQGEADEEEEGDMEVETAAPAAKAGQKRRR